MLHIRKLFIPPTNPIQPTTSMMKLLSPFRKGKHFSGSVGKSSWPKSMDPVDGPWRLLFYIQMSGSFLHPDPYLLVLTLRIHFFPLKKALPCKIQVLPPFQWGGSKRGFLGGGNKTLTSLLVGWFESQSIWKICPSKWKKSSPNFGMKISKNIWVATRVASNGAGFLWGISPKKSCIVWVGNRMTPVPKKTPSPLPPWRPAPACRRSVSALALRDMDLGSVKAGDITIWTTVKKKKRSP